MPVPKKPSDGKLNLIKFARILVYLVYTYLIVAVSFLSVGFLLLLLGANQDTPFTQFVYKIAAEFLQPFRAIFPVHQITDNAYFSAAGLFAIIMYGLFAVGIHSLISYLTLKQAKHQAELIEFEKQQEQEQIPKPASAKPVKPASPSAPRRIQ
jgi:uncharacterized protein YggT (Ycf19 family)